MMRPIFCVGQWFPVCGRCGVGPVAAYVHPDVPSATRISRSKYFQGGRRRLETCPLLTLWRWTIQLVRHLFHICRHYSTHAHAPFVPLDPGPRSSRFPTNTEDLCCNGPLTQAFHLINLPTIKLDSSPLKRVRCKEIIHSENPHRTIYQCHKSTRSHQIR